MIRSRHLIICSSLALACSCGMAGAEVTSVVPNGYDNVSGGTIFVGPLANAQRTYQLLIHSSQLTSLVGLELTGLTWRIPSTVSTPWPPSDVLFSSYNIFLSESVDPADRSLNFAENVVGTQTQVRSGPLTIDTLSFPAGTVPNDFGMVIGFDNYLYTGGNLLVEIRHNGSNGTSRNVDSISASSGGPAGYGTLFSALQNTTSSQATSGTQANFAVTQFTAIPTPGALALFGVAGLAAARRRR